MRKMAYFFILVFLIFSQVVGLRHIQEVFESSLHVFLVTYERTDVHHDLWTV